ncbi:MAG: hypothetical protein DMG73_07660 [Acidobacteria bacterium]|nr:MAG: hypothetical protein DMG73_07660 [Acidobacteriota bacterium]PYX64460.1 MAG: hypothetical protein DMG74_12930 [Acidobacteriota bacterium]
MGLDAHVRCTCIRDGRAKPHPFPDRLSFDETGEPFLTGDPSEDELEAHDRWCAESCEHGGYLLSLPLGNITRVGHLRTFLHGLEGNPGLRFPILLNKVIYDGTHTGDWIASDLAAELLKEVDTVLHSRDILASSEMEFFENMKRLCEASVETGNPIMF